MRTGKPGRPAHSSQTPWAVLRWCWRAAFAQQPLATASAVVAVALGVALALAIHLVNQSALQQFSGAINTINGQADVQLTTADQRIADTSLEIVEQHPAVRIASPVIETRVGIQATPNETDRPRELRILGIDIFRAAQLTPSLMPQPADTEAGGAENPLFASNTVFLSDSAMRALVVSPGETITILVNGRTQALVVAGNLPGATPNQSLGVMDIGSAQWLLNWPGQISRIDLGLQSGADSASLHALVSGQTGWLLVKPEQQAQQMSNLSRAYRVNLNVLALVALFTGGFIVFASMSLLTMRLSPMLALLNVLGASPRLPVFVVLGLGLLFGLAGAVLGVGVGIALAWGLISAIGSDLGGGYFDGGQSVLRVGIGAVFGFGSLGVAAALLGSILPARRLQQLSFANTLRSGQSVPAQPVRSVTGFATGLFLVGAALLALPPIGGLPLAAYLAIACWLLAGIALTGPLCATLVRWISSDRRAIWSRPAAWLASQRLARSDGSTVAALAGVVASFALVCSMAIMVHSFRVSVNDWLAQVLPADIYLRVPVSGAQAGISPELIKRVRRLPGVDQVSALRVIQTRLTASDDPVSLMARPIDRAQPSQSLPLTGALLQPPQQSTHCVAVYPSEPAANRFGLSTGDRIGLSLPLASAGAPPCFEVTAIWRDYARQQGTLAIDLQDYRTLTADTSVSNLAITAQADTSVDDLMGRVRSLFSDLPGASMRSATDIRQISLRIFDRSFAVTYALESVALLVGLFGIVTTYAGEALARAREFGMLRHLGVTKSQVVRVFAFESAASISIGVLWGAMLGSVIAQVLIHWVNPQSFHWTMQTHWPIGTMLASAVAIVGLGVLAAVIASRKTGSAAPIAAVRADW